MQRLIIEMNVGISLIYIFNFGLFLLGQKKKPRYERGFLINLVAGERPLRYLRDEFSSSNALQDRALQQSDDNSEPRDPLDLLQLFQILDIPQEPSL